MKHLRRAAPIAVLFAVLACDSTPKTRDTKTDPQKSAPPASVASAGTAAPSAPAPEPTRPAEPQNVLLLTIDSLRADMPWTGYDRKIAPNLTELAKRSVIYPNAYSVSSYTAKSVGALLAGRYPASLYRSGWFFTGYSDANLFFTEVLEQHGITSIGGHAHMYFGRGKNLNQGFDVWELVPGITFDSETDNHVTSEKVTDLAIKLLGDNASKQFFAWFHYMDPHDKYVVHEDSPDFGRKNRDRYDSEVFYTDKQIGRLFAWAEKQPWWKNTIVMISADHGEAFGEHDFYRHAFWLWEVLTRVPLLIAGPNIEPRVINERRSHIDLAPTIVELMGAGKPPEAFVGESLAPELYGEKKPEKRDVIVLDLPEDSHNPPVRAVISGDYKIIVYGEGRKVELFNLAKDPGEEQELSKKEPEQLERMKTVFDETWDGIERVEPFGGMKLRSGKLARGPREPPAAPGAEPSAAAKGDSTEPAPSAATDPSAAAVKGSTPAPRTSAH